MDTSSLKSSAFGGYEKNSVHDFLEELSLSYSVKLTELAEEKGELLDKIVVLENKIASLEETLSCYEKEKAHIATAIVAAEKEAAKILSTATLEAETLKENAAIEAKELKENTKRELKDEFDLLKDLRLSTLQAMNSYKDKLDAISKRLGAEE